MKRKRVFSWLLTLCLVLSLLPTAAWAADEPAEPVEVISVVSQTAAEPEAPAETEPELPMPEVALPAGYEAIPLPEWEPAEGDFGDLLDGFEEPADDVFGEFEVVINAQPVEEPPRAMPRRGIRGLRAIEGFSGSGTESDPWQIASAEDLARLAEIVNSGNSCAGQYFKLTQSIGMSVLCGEDASWTPIGHAWDITFNGVFDGNNKLISGLYVGGEESYVGLFGHVTGTVKNLNVSGTVTGRNYVGGIAGCNYGTLENCSFAGTVSGKSYVGGIAGCSGKDGCVDGCTVNATVTGYGTGIGGVVGWANNIADQNGRTDALSDQDSDALGTGVVKNCAYSGTLIGRSPMGLGTATSNGGTITITVTDNAFGGIVGWNNGCAIENCTNNGEINGDDFVGGVVGDSSNGGSLVDCTNNGTVAGASMLNGGIAGRVADGSLLRCTNAGSVSGGDFTGGIVGAIDKYSSMTECTNAGGAAVTGVKYVGGAVGLSNCAVTNCFNAGSVNGKYGVGGVIGWTIREVRGCRNERGASVVGTGEDGRIGGVVGNAYNLVENCCNAGSVEGAATETEGLNAPIVGGVVGHLSATLKNCQNTGSVSGGISVGGVVGGALSSSLISGCTNDGSVSGQSQVGGVVGIAYCLVSNCTNLGNGTVTGSDLRTGGVIGCLDDFGMPPEHLRNEGTVNGNKYVGGVVGMALVAVNGAVNEGTVNGTENVGGVAGYCIACSGCVNNGTVNAADQGTNTGGITGICVGEISSCVNNGTVIGLQNVGGITGGVQAPVRDCTNAGTVTAENGMVVGGIAGYCNTDAVISACKNEGSVSSAAYVGGIVGHMGSTTGIRDCQNTASGVVISTNSMCGGIAGQANATVTNCTNAGTVTGTAITGGIVGAAQGTAVIDHCTNLNGSAVSASTSALGGIVGLAAASVTACVNEAKVVGTTVIGGICGDVAGAGAVSECRNTAEIVGNDLVGGIAGIVGELDDEYDPSGLVENCINKGRISGGTCTGGIAGIDHGTVRNCENTVALTGTSNGVGGVVGFVKEGSVLSGCTNRGAITAGDKQTGGVVGANAGTVEDCVNYAVVSGGDFSDIGGIAGSSNGTISGCTNKANVTSNSETTGGIAGSNGGTITGCSNAGQITNASGHVGGIAGQGNGSIANCANTGKVSSKTSGNVYAGGIAGRCSGSITNCTNSAIITAGNGVGGIVGIISGGGSVTGCGNSGRINAPSGAAGGIVGALYNNCNVADCTNSGYINASGQDSVGGIIGIAYNNNTVTNCTNSGAVVGNNNVGGILGENGSSGTYSKLTNSGTVSGNYETGGIAGDATAAFYDCLNTGSVTGSGGNDTHGTGGICGRLSGSGAKAERCKNEGTISGTYFVGGIVGLDNDASLYSSLNTGAVNSRNTSAGIARVGGVVGYIQNATVSKCVNYASVGSGTNINHVGGIAGSAAKTLFDFCRNYATITGRQEIGGIVGYVTHIDNSGTTIQRCINTGHVTASGGSIADVGGIVGKADYYTTVNECANNNPNAKVQADTGKYGGGIAGLINEGTISNSYNTGYVFAHGARGGIVGEMKYHCTMATCFNYAGGDQIPVNGVAYDRGALAGQYDPNATTWTNNYYSYYLGLPPTGKQGAATADSSGEYMYLGAWGRGAFNEQGSFSGFNFSTVYMMQSDRPRLRMEGGVATYSDTGPTSTADPIPTQIDIYTVQDLEIFRNNVNAGTDYSRTTIRLCSDLDMSGINWTPFGTDTLYFNGTFDGQGNTIYNLTVNSGNLVVGLFGSVSGTIRNLEVHGTVTATNASQAYAGGLVGFVYGGTVESCAFYGEVKYSGSGTCYAGGLVSLMNPSGTVQNCYHVGAVSGSGTTVSAGLVAYLAAGTLTNCYHYTGQISGTYSAGVAAINGGTVKNCFVLEGTATDLVTMGTSTNVAFKPAADFLDTTLINAGGWAASWYVGDPSPMIPALSYQTILYANDGTTSGRICGVKRFRGTLPACPFTRSGYTFLGWNTAEDGSGTWYEDCGSVGTPPEGLFVLYAQWLQGTPYYGYSSSNAGTLLDNNNSSTFNCPDLERGATATITFRTNDAVRPCAIAFLTAGSDCETPPGWRLVGKIHESDGDWTLLATSDGASLSRAGRTVYAKLSNVGEDYYSFYRIVWQGPSSTLSLKDAHLMVANASTDVRKPLTLHSNDAANQTNVVNANNGASVMLGNPFTSNNKYFLNWNTAADGSGVSYANYAAYTVDGVTDLYAQWLDGTHYRNYTALKAYDQFTATVDGVPQNDSQYQGYSTQEYTCLVDDNVNTKWCVGVRADAFWSLEFTTDDYVKPIGYVIVTAEDTARWSGRNPKNWTLEGLSKDGTWVMLDGILQDQSLPAANHAEICREIGNDQEYCTYRITFRGLGSGTTFQLSELYLITDGSAREPVVTFDAHGGAGSMANVSAKTQATVQLPESGFTREGYHFTGWNTEPDGSGRSYNDEAYYQVTGDATLYAQWAQKAYTVTFLGENDETLYETLLTAGQLPVYKGEAPFKENTDECIYYFDGWEPTIVPVTQNATYRVRFRVTLVPVPYLDENGETQTCADYTIITNQTALASGWYVVSGEVTINDRITVDGDVHLILVDGAKLIAKKGIDVDEGDSFTVYAQSTGDGMGALFAGTTTGEDVTCDQDKTAIGCSEGQYGGTITINGGTVKANGDGNGAGIGGGSHTRGGAVTINGGAVTATCNLGSFGYGAGIGGGKDGCVENITINGGTVTARGGSAGGAGVGGGSSGYIGEITITGGTVLAVGGKRAAGVGCGSQNSGGTVTISGGTVTAIAGAYDEYVGGAAAQAIGDGQGRDETFVTRIFINGMKVYASEDVESPVPTDKREETCRSNWAKVMKCEHIGYSYTDNGETHTGTCLHCGTEGETEQHVYGDVSYTWATDYSTCTASHTCASCSHVESEQVSTTSQITTQPTCEGKGKTTYTATFTNAAFQKKSKTVTNVAPLGHDIVKHDAKAATCTAIGWNAYDTCKRCDYTTYEEIAALGHDLVHHDAKAPTCTAIGWDAYDTCKRCDYTTYVEKSALGHDLVHHDAKAATCTAIGWNAYDTCKRRDYTTYAEIAALGHDIVHHDAKAATCTAIGWNAYDTCKRCDYTTYAEIPALGHDIVHHDAKAATCTAVGWNAYDTCKRCDYTTYAEIPATGHDYKLSGWTWTGYTAATANFTCTHDASHVKNIPAEITSVRTEPTAEENGSVVYTAAVTFEGTKYTDQKTETIPALGHDYVLSGWTWTGYTAAKATFTDKNGGAPIELDATITSKRTEPSCTEAGKVVYTATVTLNEKKYTDEKTEVLTALGHDLVHHDAKAPTCTAIGWNAYDTCSRCDYTTYVEIPATGHTPAAAVEENRKEATCTEAGSYDTVVYCATCGAELSRETTNIPAIGHDYKLTGWTWNGVTAATATFTCTHDASHVENIPAEITSERTEPTAEENGSVVYTAAVTFEEVEYKDTKTEILPALGHEYVLDGWTWTDYEAATATFIDKNGGAPITVDAKITSERTEPSCEAAGKVVYTATVTFNGTDYTDEKTEDLPALGHDLVHHDAKAPTCTEIGWDAYDTCSRCDYTTYVEKAALGHDLVHHDAKAPTCTEGGWDAYDTCSRYDYTTYVEKAALGHDLVHHDAKAPTCTEIGWDAYDACSRCDYTTYAELPATGHDWGEPVYEWSADFEKCTATVTCKNDVSHKITETVTTNFVLTKPSTYKFEGTGVYKATFENELFTEQTHEIVIPAVSCDGGDTCPGKHFTDEPGIDHWAHIPIDWAVVNKITFGTTPTTFSPDEACTRAQFVTFLWRTMAQPEPTLTENPFKDVSEDDYYYKAVLWAVENGITLGTSETTFSPDASCVRAQVVTFLWRMEGKQESKVKDNPFKDVAESAYYYDAVLWAVEKGITEGTSETTFSPNDTCTRAHCLAFLYREFAK